MTIGTPVPMKDAGGGANDAPKDAPATILGIARMNGRFDRGGAYWGVKGGPGMAIAASRGRRKTGGSPPSLPPHTPRATAADKKYFFTGDPLVSLRKCRRVHRDYSNIEGQDHQYRDDNFKSRHIIPHTS